CSCLQKPEVRPWREGPRRGFNIACWHKGCLDAAVGPTLSHALSVGARGIALAPTWYVPDGSGGAPREDPEKSPTLDELERAAFLARSLGLEVLLKPHVDREDGGSRTEIDPADWQLFWEAYRSYVLAVADVAT